MNLLRGAALVLAATVLVGGLGHEEGDGRIVKEAEISDGNSAIEGDWEKQNFGSRTSDERSDGVLERLKVDENAPSLPSRSLKRGRGRGFPTLSSREESNSVSIHRGRGGSRSREKSEKEGKAVVKADLVTKQKSRFRPRKSGSSLVGTRQRTN